LRLDSFIDRAFFAGLKVIGDAFVSLGASIKQSLSAAIGAAAGAWSALVASATSARDSVVSAFTGLAGTVAGVFDNVVSAIESAFSNVLAFAQDIATKIGNLISGILAQLGLAQQKAAAAPSGGTGGQPALAAGGQVRGPGGPTGDKILAWLSDTEFVQQARAVSYYGLDFMHAINQMQLPRNLFRGFSLGGLVDGVNRSLAIPRFAAGGLADIGPTAPGLRPFVLQIGAEQIGGLFARESAVEQVMRFAAQRHIARAGRAPIWHGA